MATVLKLTWKTVYIVFENCFWYHTIPIVILEIKTVWYKSKVIAFIKLNYLLKSPFANTLLIRRQQWGLITTLKRGFLIIFRT